MDVPLLTSSPFPAVFIGIYLSTLVLVYYWVYSDARSRGYHPFHALLWGLAVGLFLPVAALYLYDRDATDASSRSKTGASQVVQICAIAGLLAFGVGATAAPPEPATQGRYSVLALPVALLVAIMFVRRRDLPVVG